MGSITGSAWSSSACSDLIVATNHVVTSPSTMPGGKKYCEQAISTVKEQLTPGH